MSIKTRAPFARGIAVAMAFSLLTAVSPARAEHVMTLHEQGLGPKGPFEEICIDPDTAREVDGFPVDRTRFETIWVGEDGTVTTTAPDPDDPDTPVRVRVLLPPGYQGDEQRYPVLYFNPGGLGDASDVVFGVPHEFPVHCFSAEREPVIWVFPDGHSLTSHPDSPWWEIFHVRTLVEAVDGRYRTLADRAHRATVGISAGGYSVLKYAARNPEVFAAVASISGAPDAYAEHESYFWATRGAVEVCLLRLYPALGTHGCPDDPDVGGAVTDQVRWRNHNPVDLAPNLRGTWVYAGAGNGVPCDDEDYDATYDVIHNVQYPGAALLEAVLVRPGTERFGEALTKAGVDHMLDLHDCGGHDLPLYWRELENLWPGLIDAFGSPPPEDFDHRRVDEEFSVWGWTFGADPDRAPEFLDVKDASRQGVTLTGSGTTSVVTAPYFGVNQKVRVTIEGPDGTRTTEVVRAKDRRLELQVELGLPHQHQQYTPEQRVLEAAEGPAYWRTATVTFAPGAGNGARA